MMSDASRALVRSFDAAVAYTTGRTQFGSKLLCSENAMSVTTHAVQLFGGYGFIGHYPVERIMRDAKVTQIYEGTNQVQGLLIAKAVYAGARAS
jgi:hypothetical protein